MATLTPAPAVLPDTAPGHGPGGRGRPRTVRVWRGVVLVIAALYFLVPMVTAFVFTVNVPNVGFTLDAYTQIFTVEGFVGSLSLSLGLAAATIVLVLLLLLPAMLAVRLAAPRLKPVLEVLCTLPMVVPPISFTAGISALLPWAQDVLAPTPFYQTIITIQDQRFPLILVLAYVVLALPFAYRSLDSALTAIDVRTLVEAARNCGASWPRVMLSVIVPNIRTGIAGAAFLTLALVLGEYTVARLLGYVPFPVWIVMISGSQAQVSVAVSVFSLLLTWALLLAVSSAGVRKGSES
ncbi:MAG: ABC transporter permease subunit [Actinomycetes bacterium]|nr:MAG: ABC transporter permease [Actinomycetota bacterium]